MPVDPQLLRQLEESVAAEQASAFSSKLQKRPESPKDDDDALSAVLRARSQVHAGADEAAGEWGEAEAALSKALQAAKQRRRAELEQEAQAESHLSPVKSAPGSLAIPDMERIGSLSRALERKSPRSHLEQSSVALASESRNEYAFGERARRMRTRAADAAKKLEDHSKRKLRVKITGILNEVKRRQGLRYQQENARKFREQRYVQGFGPQPWVGDADEFALGLGEPNPEQEYLEGAATPRRRCILESLSLEELDMVRANPRWFLDSGPSPGPGTGDGDDDLDGFESLIDFFTPARKDKGVPIETYVQNLRARLAAAAAEQSQQSAADVSQQLSGGSSWQSLLGKRTASTSLSRSPTGLGQPSPSRDDFLTLASTTSYGTAISSQKREPIRDDKMSPTLLKVKEVFRRREENDAAVLEERQRSMEQRIARNAFKATEQQKELQSTQVQQKELHKVRMLEAKERVQTIEHEQQERMHQMKEQKMLRLRKALDKAEDACEKKRDKATENLEEWSNGVIRAQRHMRQKERQKLREHKQFEESYVERLIKVGNDRTNAEETQAQKNDKLKSRIQSSLVEQLEERRRFECDCLAVALDEKLDAARHRRQTQLSKYRFLEKAFGEQVLFDPKFAFNAQRHGDEWKSKLQRSVGASSSSPKF